MEEPMSLRENDLPWLLRKSPLLFELVVFTGCLLGVDSTSALHELGRPIVPHIFRALFMGLCVALGLRYARWKKEMSNSERNGEHS
jgi:hypothetical protein